jgi:hypothetical protein
MRMVKSKPPNGKNGAQPPAAQSAPTPAATTPAGTPALPLLYIRPEPLDPARHGALRLRDRADLSLFRKTGIAPITLSEFPAVARHYPIVFLTGPAGQPPSIAAVLGSDPNENLFVGDDGRWAAETYVPAYFRRYPFITGMANADDRIAVFIDAGSERLGTDKGEPLFEKGEPTGLTKDALEFCRRFHRDAALTTPFVQALVESGVLVERTVQARDQNAPRLAWRGFMAVDERKLAELPDATFLAWRKPGWLGAIYLHLFSIGHFAGIARRKLGAAAATEDAIV